MRCDYVKGREVGRAFQGGAKQELKIRGGSHWLYGDKMAGIKGLEKEILHRWG